MIKKDGLKVEGHRGTWYIIDETTKDGKKYFLLESEQFGDEAACVAVDAEGKLMLEEIWNGVADIHQYLEKKEFSNE